MILDAGAVIGLSRNDHRLRRIFKAAQKAGVDVRVPMVVVAEAVRGNGPRDATVNLVLAQTAPQHQLTERRARAAGQLLCDSGSSSAIDALVVAEALECSPAIIWTSDANDLRQLLGRHRGVIVESF